jgi:hypothetical protein
MASDIQQKILDKIRRGEIAMRPRAYFALSVIALAAVAAAFVLVSVFILNFILFSIRINSKDALLSFGPRGLVAFLWFFPWTLLVLDVLLVLIGQWLVRGFRFGYRMPIVYVIAGLILVTGATAFVIDRTGLNERLLRLSDEGGLPGPIGGLYGSARHLPPPRQGICRCVVTSINGNMLTVTDTRGSTTLKVLLPPGEAYATTSGFSVGDVVFIAGDGDRDGDDVIIRAFGVRKLPRPQLK